MPSDRPLRNLTRDHLLGVYTELQSDPAGKKYNLRKELQTDKRETTVHTNRWLTRDQYLEMARQEIAARGLEVPGDATTPAVEVAPITVVDAPNAAGEPTHEGTAVANAPVPVDPEAGLAPAHAPLGGVTSGAIAEGLTGGTQAGG